jgi:putative ABC transport system ATP-binding protein
MTAAGPVPQKHADTDALQARDLYRFFRAGEEETLALRGVALRVRRGETVAVIGPSGSGKSTLLACLAGLDEPDGGIVHVGGERISHRPEAERARVRARRIGVLLQSGNLIAHLDISANIRLAQIAAPRNRKQSIAELLDQVGLGHRARDSPARDWPSLWPTTRTSCSPTSRPVNWTAPLSSASWNCCGSGRRRGAGC